MKKLALLLLVWLPMNSGCATMVTLINDYAEYSASPAGRAAAACDHARQMSPNPKDFNYYTCIRAKK